MRVRSGRLTSVTTDPYTQPGVAVPWPQSPERRAPPQPAVANRILVAGVGYRNLRDMSTGPELVDRLRVCDWPDAVHVEDLSSGAVHVLHWLQAQAPFAAAVLVASVRRGRPPGTVSRVDWTSPARSGEAVQAAIAESVTGVIGLDTLLTVLSYFDALPPRVVVVAIEPRDDDWGPEFSPPVNLAMDEACRVVQAEVAALLP